MPISPSTLSSVLAERTSRSETSVRSVSLSLPLSLGIAVHVVVLLVGEKVVRKCPMLGDVTIAEGAKDELVISGNDIENVSQSAASITDKCRVKEKDVSDVQ
jgi:ribosomal protein L6P/L9E